MHSSTQLLGWIQLGCGITFGIDVFYEIHLAILADTPLPAFEWLHLSIEVVAVIALLMGFRIARNRRQHWRRTAEAANERLSNIRSDFDAIIRAQFREWKLSEAEADVALLTLRGVRNQEIAALRQTQESTVKSQLTSIFRKAGVKTRNELIGLFMDEFLDYGATNGETTSQAK